MIRIGITGAIGSGKSSTCKIFETLDVPVFYSDDMSKQIMTTDRNVISSIKKYFGDDIYNRNKLDTRKLGEIVFNDRSKLDYLEELLHPKIFSLFDAFCEQNSTAPYVLFESALLNKEEYKRLFDKIILIESRIVQDIQRVIKRDNLTEAQVRNRMKNQSFENVYSSKNLIPLYNGESKIVLMEKVLSLHKKLIQK